MIKLSDYIKETKGEMKHVSWPTKKETTDFTVLVIAISITVGVLLGVFDFIFRLGLQNLILQ